MRFNEVMKELYDQKVILTSITENDIKRIVRQNTDKSLEQIVDIVKMEDYNMVSEEINDYLGY